MRSTRGASLYKAVLVRGRIPSPARGASLYKAVLVRGRIPTPRSRGFAIQGCTGSRTHSKPRSRGFAIQGCTGSRTHSNAPLAGLRYTRLYWFEDAFQRPARGASLYKAVLVRGRIPTPRSRGFAIQGCTGSRTHSNAPLAGLRYTRLYWFEDAFQRPARGASLYKAVLVRGRIPTPRSRWKSSAISRKKPHKSGWVGNPGSYMWLVWVVVLSSVLAGDISYSWLYSTSNRES